MFNTKKSDVVENKFRDALMGTKNAIESLIWYGKGFAVREECGLKVDTEFHHLMGLLVSIFNEIHMKLDSEKLDIKLEINDNDSIISTVSDSNYISIMSNVMADKAEKAGLIKSLQITNYPQIAKRSIFLIKLRDVEISELKRKFWEYIKSNN